MTRKRGIRTAHKVANAEESTFAMYLEELRRSGEVMAWEYEPLSLKIGPACSYTPDFVALHVERDRGEAGDIRAVRIVAYEVKGTYIRDDAAVKLKAAAERFRWMQFVLAIVRRKRNGGGIGQIELQTVPPSDSLHLIAALPKFGNGGGKEGR